MHSLQGKNILITGGTSGIGLAVAENFVASGAEVTLTGRRDSGAETAAKIGANFVRCDSTDEDQVENSLRETVAAHGKIDILVINAGMADDEGSIEEFDSARMRAMMDLNCNGVFYHLKHAPQHMHDAGYQLVDQWDNLEKSLELVGQPDLSLDRYRGYCFQRTV